MPFSGKLLPLLGLYIALAIPLYAQRSAPVREGYDCTLVQNGITLKWTKVTATAGLKLPARQGNALLPRKYQIYTTPTGKLKAFMEATGKKHTDVILPFSEEPGCQVFSVQPSGTMSPELAAKFPELISLKGVARADKNATLRLDYNGSELNAEIIWKGVSYIIAPWKKGSRTYYLLYKKEDSGTEKKPFREK